MIRQATSSLLWRGLLSTIIAISMTLIVTTVYADKSQGAARAPLTPKYYYLTTDEYQGDLATAFLPDCEKGVDCACADGYHMASIMELILGTGLVYDTELGLTFNDSGYGPPIYQRGWVRSGLFADDFNNCSEDLSNPWTSTSDAVRGLKAALDPRTDGSGPGIAGGWVSGYYSIHCGEFLPVWCLED